MTDWLLPFLCGLGASIISAWGVGGGTLLLLVMTLFLNVDQRTAQGINLLFFLPTAISALICHAKSGYLDKPLFPLPWSQLFLVPGSQRILMLRFCASPLACICCSPASPSSGRKKSRSEDHFCFFCACRGLHSTRGNVGPLGSLHP